MSCYNVLSNALPLSALQKTRWGRGELALEGIDHEAGDGDFGKTGVRMEKKLTPLIKWETLIVKRSAIGRFKNAKLSG